MVRKTYEQYNLVRSSEASYRCLLSDNTYFYTAIRASMNSHLNIQLPAFYYTVYFTILRVNVNVLFPFQQTLFWIICILL